jgi:Holliday junction DNA helicase RuvA
LIAAVRGALEAAGPDWVIVDVGGVSLRVLVPSTAAMKMPPIGETLRLLTYLQVREDALTLYGFLSQSDLEFFEQVTAVTGVGPKIALAMLSAAPSDALRHAIASENLDSLTKVPGVGRKLAGRLILELRGKLTPADGSLGVILGPADPEVQAALVGLGYAASDAQEAIASLPAGKDLPVEDRIRLALRFFAKR